MAETRAYIFDMDDTIARTGPVWRFAEMTLLKAIGTEWTPELSAQYKGMNALDVAATIHRVLQPKTHTLAQCQDLMRSTLIEQFRTSPTITPKISRAPSARGPRHFLGPGPPFSSRSSRPAPRSADRCRRRG